MVKRRPILRQKCIERRGEAECACALNQDCAADFCLARQISGGWKIIWSWLWEVVGSGRRMGDVGEKV